MPRRHKKGSDPKGREELLGATKEFVKWLEEAEESSEEDEG